MQAIRVHQTGGPEVLAVDELPTPEPGPGQARVRIEFAGLNFFDIYQRSGQYKTALPVILGQEGGGVVEAVGPDVTDVRVGDRVAFASGAQGSYATQALVPAWRLVRVPDTLEMRVAVAVLLQGLTAHYLARSTYALQSSDTALIHAAAGGVGQLLVQIAKSTGARVIATVSSAQKAGVARECGADEVILYTQSDFEADTKRLTGGRGVDVVYDSVGRDTFDKSLNCLRPRGLLALYGQSSGAVAPVDPQILNARGSLFLTRPTLIHYTATREEMVSRADDLFNWILEGKLKVRVDRTFPLSQAAEAHRHLASRQAMGKILLTVAA